MRQVVKSSSPLSCVDYTRWKGKILIVKSFLGVMHANTTVLGEKCFAVAGNDEGLWFCGDPKRFSGTLYYNL